MEAYDLIGGILNKALSENKAKSLKLVQSDSHDSYLTSKVITPVIVPISEFSVAGWVKFNKISRYSSVIGVAFDPEGDWLLQTRDFSEDSFAWAFFMEKSGFITLGTSPTPIGEWIHVSLTQNGSTLTIYMDGVDVGNVSYTRTTEFVTPLCIGAYNADRLSGGPTSGSSANFYNWATWTKELSPAQVLDLATNKPDLSKGTWPTDMVSRWSMDLEGVDPFVRVPDNTIIPDLSGNGNDAKLIYPNCRSALVEYDIP
jgi:hypothetical protein